MQETVQSDLDYMDRMQVHEVPYMQSYLLVFVRPGYAQNDPDIPNASVYNSIA